jgi:hypothetical protein
MFWKLLVSAGLLCAVATSAIAAPTLSVSDGGVVAGNQQWLISATPDPAVFVPNSSLAAELDFTFHGSIVSFTMDNTFWNKPPVSNFPGNNPFTGTVTTTQIDNAPANDTLFIAAGSDLFATATSHLIGTLVTSGVGGQLDWGGHTVLSGPNAYTQARIAQNGVNYNGITGSLTIPTPPLCTLEGDFSCNGAVENADLTLLLNNWTKPVPPVPDGWIGIPQPTGPAVDNDELTALLNNWGQHVPGAGSGAGSAAAVPEPTTVTLALVGLAGFGFVVRHRRGSK